MTLIVPLHAFLAWATFETKRLSGLEAMISVVLCKPTNNRAAYLEVETGERIGRLTFWSAGSAHGGVLEIRSSEQLWVKNWDSIEQTAFDVEFARFLEFFLKPHEPALVGSLP